MTVKKKTMVAVTTSTVPTEARVAEYSHAAFHPSFVMKTWVVL